MFCLPLPRDKFQTTTPYVLITLAVLNGLLLLPVLAGERAQLAVMRYAFVPAHPTTATVFASMFLHVGLWHYIGNMWFLWIFGRKVECALGHLRFSIVYLVCGLGGQLFHFLFNLHSLQPCVGASGAISGIAGLYFILFPRERFYLHLYLGWWRVKTIDSTTRGAVGAWIGEQALLGLLTRVGNFSSVAFWAHVGGFATGALVGLWQQRRLSVAPLPEMPLIGSIDDDPSEQPSGLTTLNLNG